MSYGFGGAPAASRGMLRPMGRNLAATGAGGRPEIGGHLTISHEWERPLAILEGWARECSVRRKRWVAGSWATGDSRRRFVGVWNDSAGQLAAGLIMIRIRRCSMRTTPPFTWRVLFRGMAVARGWRRGVWLARRWLRA
jgi:hypothetical protein